MKRTSSKTQAGSVVKYPARISALIAGLVVVTFTAIFLVRNPYGYVGVNTSTRLIMIAIILLAWISMLAAWYGRLGILLASFGLAFVPGVYLLMTPGWFAFIGIGQLGFLLSAALIVRNRRAGPKGPPPQRPPSP